MTHPQTVQWPKCRLVDLSVPIMNNAMEPQEQVIMYWDHATFGRKICKDLGVDPTALPDGMGNASETLHVHSHAGTHIDAPYHFGPMPEGKPAKRIDEVPLEWLFGDGVVLDFHDRPAGYEISAADIEAALKKIAYTLKPMDIVCIRTDAYKRHLHPDFFICYPGMSAEATHWLLDRGIKVMAIDAWGFDIPYPYMKKNFEAGRPNSLWPAHFLGRDREYMHAEKLANLDKLPPYGFKISMFPIKIDRASGAWIRAVAFVPE